MSKTTVVPNRFREEPLDLAGYDAWQDFEGLTDASDKCKAAWRAFRPGWREARAVELRRLHEIPRPDWREGLDPWQAAGMRRALEMGGKFGLCARVPGTTRPLSPGKRAHWWQWRSRVIRHDPSLWGALWCMLGGRGSGWVAVRLGRKAGNLERGAATVLGWLGKQMYAQPISK